MDRQDPVFGADNPGGAKERAKVRTIPAVRVHIASKEQGRGVARASSRAGIDTTAKGILGTCIVDKPLYCGVTSWGAWY